MYHDEFTDSKYKYMKPCVSYVVNIDLDTYVTVYQVSNMFSLFHRLYFINRV